MQHLQIGEHQDWRSNGEKRKVKANVDVSSSLRESERENQHLTQDIHASSIALATDCMVFSASCLLYDAVRSNFYKNLPAKGNGHCYKPSKEPTGKECQRPEQSYLGLDDLKEWQARER